MDPITIQAWADEFEKIAKKKEKKVGLNVPEKLVAGLGGLTGAGIGAQMGTQLAGESLQKDIARTKMRTSPEQMKELASKISPKAKYLVHEGDLSGAMHLPRGGMLPKPFRGIERAQHAKAGIPREMSEAAFREGFTLTPRKAGAHIGAHELGHARFGEKKLGRFVRKLRLPGGLAAGLAAPGMAAFGEEGGTAQKLSPLVGLAGAAPVLGEEAYASLKGYKGMKQTGKYAPAALKAGRRQLMKAWGTYGAKLGIPAVGAPLAIMGLRSALRKRKERLAKQTASETA